MPRPETTPTDKTARADGVRAVNHPRRVDTWLERILFYGLIALVVFAFVYGAIVGHEIPH